MSEVQVRMPGAPVVVWPGTCVYLADNVILVSDRGRRLLRSVSDRTCVVPRTQRSFSDKLSCNWSTV